ncbi:hypothetical protein CHISP_2153 [Chitinispirillum alkaliphilum]|nr:hypothetical protein CHISP_2153 [Chitinispirillum alkaliphilum]
MAKKHLIFYIIFFLLVQTVIAAPVLNGFFIQPTLGYGVVGWNRNSELVFDSQQKYDEWVKTMADIGAEILIYQWSTHHQRDQQWFAQAWGAHATADFAFYDIGEGIINDIPTQSWTSPTTWPGSDVEPLRRALDACEKNGVSLWIGLYLNEHPESYNWWEAVSNSDIMAKDSAIIEHHISRSLFVIDELSEKFAAHPSFAGFYYSIEIANVAFIPERNWPYLAHILDIVAQRVHEKAPGARLSVSPFFNTSLASAEEYGKMWEYALQNSALDVIIIQDGAGVDPHTLTQSTNLISPYYAAVRDAAISAGTSFWANPESFTNEGNRMNPQFRPADIDQFTRQLEIASVYTDTLVSFSFQYMDPNPFHTLPAGSYTPPGLDEAKERLRLYNDYKRYYESVHTGVSSPVKSAKHSVNRRGNVLSVHSPFPVKATIASLSGRIVEVSDLGSGEVYYDIGAVLKNKPNGVYVVQFRAGEVLHSFRFVNGRVK